MSAFPTVNINDSESIKAALAEQAPGIAQPEDEGVTDEQIVQTALNHLESGKTRSEVKTALLDEFDGLDQDVDDLIDAAYKSKATVAHTEAVQSEIRALESVNKELFEAVDPEEVSLPSVPDGPDEDRLAALREINRILTDNINQIYEDTKDQPKYGSGLAVPLRLQGKPYMVWVDENQVDVDTGEKYNLSPEAKKIHQQKLEERRAEIADEFIAEYDKPKEPHSHYAMTKEEYERESEKEFPVYVLPKQAGPAWDDSIPYGSAGKVIRKASEYNESHPAGMLVDFLVSLGSVIGRGPYFNINETKHYTNEFMARVGQSSKSRKGTGRDAIDGILKLVDPDWYSNRIESGFGSGEAIINRVRDTVVEMKMNHRTGKFESTTIPGVTDKRLCIREGELASIFVLAGKPDQRADIVIRDGWDGKPLRNVVKGKSKDGFSMSAKCEEPHLSISGDTTISELRQKMPAGADANGFGNRFLYVYVYRVKDCPQGGPPIDWWSEIAEFREVVQFARTVKHVSMSDQGRKWWNTNYARLENDGPDGLAGRMTARAAAHIRRLAMIYALIDFTDQIELEHFHAAKKLWDYCEESAMYIFGGLTKEQLRIVNWIEQRGAATFKQVREDLYHRNKPAASIRADLDGLVNGGQLAIKSGVYAAGHRKLVA